MDVERYKRRQQSGNGAAMATSRKRPFAVVPNEFVVPARVQVQRLMPVWMAKVRWLVLRGSKSPFLAVYRHVSTFVMHENPLRVMLLDANTTVHAAGEKGLIVVSSRVRRNDTWAMGFESSGQRKRMYELVKMWIELSAFLQSLTSFKSVARSQCSVVYRCHDRGDAQRVYALKRVNRVQCANEVEVTEKLANLESIQPYVARYVYMFEDSKDNSVTIAMMYYQGGSLADRIREFGALPENVVRSVTSSLCMALLLLQQHGILHLDVKAGNILFDAKSSRSFRNLKLVDFGSSMLYAQAREIDDKPPAARHHKVSGTYGCMAPERFDGRYGPEADVYGAGVVLYHMVTGEIPFIGTDSYQIMAKNMHGIVHFTHPRWRRVSKELRHLTERMLEKDPEKRITVQQIIKLSWLFQPHSSHDTVAVEDDMSPPFDPCVMQSDPFAFFA